ncbi:hypothetical protein H5410_046730 [Solanum commersonii]|uniref:Uncharacterized protein n=1 Tax=Solanum commersonii TaxID=4109 RepID=A0A9J5XH87_SOLCO|nr:hypothetical protein H5410_046730 [Solanum commersonii]
MLTILCEAQSGFDPDDHLLFARGDQPSIAALNLENIGKSSFYFDGINEQIQESLLLQFGFTLGELPFKYPGIHLSTNKMPVGKWDPLIVRIVARISS